MRTTLVIDDALLRRAKHRAAEQNLTVSEVVSQALRVALEAPTAAVSAFKMPTFGGKEAQVHHEPADFVLVVDDEQLPLGSPR